MRVRTVGYFGFLLERDVEPLPSPFPPELADAARAALVEALLAGHTPHPDQARVRRALERLGFYWRRSGGRLTQGATEHARARLAAPLARAGSRVMVINAGPGLPPNPIRPQPKPQGPS